MDGEILRDGAPGSVSRISSEKYSDSGFSAGGVVDGGASPQQASPVFTFTFRKASCRGKAEKASGREKLISGADVARIALSVSEKRNQVLQARHVLPTDFDEESVNRISELEKIQARLVPIAAATIAIIAAAVVIVLLL